MTTVKDQFGRKNVLDFIENAERGLYPVGRLDYATSGLLIITNDGELAYKLTHPKNHIEKTYIAKVHGIPSEAKLSSFRKGLPIDERYTAPAKANIIKRNSNAVIKITLTEGRNRQIRKMCNFIGHSVISLKRISIGKINLCTLEKGKYRYLTSEEIIYLKSL